MYRKENVVLLSGGRQRLDYDEGGSAVSLRVEHDDMCKASDSVGGHRVRLKFFKGAQKIAPQK